MPGGKNDTEQLFKSLIDATRQGTEDIIKVINSISGPFAFVFYDKLNGRVWFGRDCLGRRSLLLHHTTLERDGYDAFIVASVTDGHPEKGWQEVEADGVYHIELGQLMVKQIVPNQVPFLQPRNAIGGGLCLTVPYPPLNLEKPPGSLPLLTRESQTVYELKELLQDAVRLRVQNIFTPGQPQQESTCKPKQSRVAILFSGGLDCTVLARLVHEVLPHNESIDLLNVAFENPRAVQTHSNSLIQSKSKEITKSLDNMDSTIDVNGDIPSTTKKHTPEASATIDPYSLCPDRLTCLSSLQDLKASCPTRKFNLVLINVPLSETLAHRQTVISLMYPHNTEMDLSIALAFYFSSRGLGVLHDPSDSLEAQPLPYSTPSRILLSGLGADELFAGYARHETAFQRGGYEALLAELELDVGRLGKRNLGRDDRVISHWGKEGRYPYLDERVVRWAMEQPVWKKCDFEKCKGGENGVEGGKMVLRLVAQFLGMEGVAREKKRAIQFGAKTAKMEIYPGSRRVKGTRVVN